MIGYTTNASATSSGFTSGSIYNNAPSSMAELKKGAGWYNNSGYSFHCEKYVKLSVVQSCLKEETRSCKECNGNFNCMGQAHRNLENAWAQYNLQIKGGNQGQAYQPPPNSAQKKHMTEQERDKKRFDDRVYQNGVSASRDYDKMMYNLRQMAQNQMNQTGDIRLYQTVIMIESNWNYYYNCITKTASIDMAQKFNKPYDQMEIYMGRNIQMLADRCTNQ